MSIMKGQPGAAEMVLSPACRLCKSSADSRLDRLLETDLMKERLICELNQLRFQSAQGSEAGHLVRASQSPWVGRIKIEGASMF